MRIFVVDAGAFGTAMAAVLAKSGRHDVSLLIQNIDYDHLEMYLYLLRTRKNRWGLRENNLYLPGVTLPENIHFTDSFEGAATADVIFLTVPSKYLQRTYGVIRNYLVDNKKTILVLCTKGFKIPEGIPCGMYIQKDLKKNFKNNYFAVISGYTPAGMIAADEWKSFAVSVASSNIGVIGKVRQLFLGTNIGTIGTTDVAGVSLGGAVKNAYAVGYGLLLGLSQEKSASEFLVRAHKEMKVFIKHFKAREETWESPAVKGDFYLSCVGELCWESRNVSFGKFLATYPGPSAVKKFLSRSTVEGFESLNILWGIAHQNGLSAPLLYCIHNIVEYGASPSVILEQF